MTNNINKIICDAINNAVEKKKTHLNRDITYLCIVTHVYSDNAKTYQLTYENFNYTVTLNNITLNLYDKVHLVIPQGDFSKKYVLEDICYNHLPENQNLQIDEKELETIIEKELKGE